MDYIKMNRMMLEKSKRIMEKRMDLKGIFDGYYINIRGLALTLDIDKELELEIYNDSDGIVAIGFPLGKAPATVSFNIDDTKYCRYANSSDFIRTYLPTLNLSPDLMLRVDRDCSYFEALITPFLKEVAKKVEGSKALVTIGHGYGMDRFVRKDYFPLIVFNFNKGIFSVMPKRKTVSFRGDFMLNYPLNTRSLFEVGVLDTAVNSKFFPRGLMVLEAEYRFKDGDLTLDFEGICHNNT